MIWIDELKIAMINKDDDKFLNLIDDLPNFDSTDDLICARVLIGEFIKQKEKEKKSLSATMQKLKKSKFFLEV